jgi:WD40 repeat protein
MTIRRRHEVPVQGYQYGSENAQWNYFAPVTQNLFVGAAERLGDVCFDPSSLERDLDLAYFTGRQWLIDQIEEFIARRPRGYVVIQAEAGVGKSSLAAHLVWSRPWLHHFTRLPGGRSPESARKSLAAQVIARWDLLDKWAPGGALPPSSARPDWFSRLLEAAARKRDEQAQGREPIVLVIDGLDEAESEASADYGLPLGLPVSLPDGVFVVATSRFGIDRALHAVRNPADWLQIEVEGPDNLADMRWFLDRVTSPDRGDGRLAETLRQAGVSVGWFQSEVAKSCAGVWIYLRYVLDEIREGTRDARSVGRLPEDLAAYYAEQIERWRGAPGDEGAFNRWEQVRLPLIGALAAARAPLTVAELATFGQVQSQEAARAFIEETARAFLSRLDEDLPAPRYALRHQSLRDLLTGSVPAGRPDLADLAQMLAARARMANERIATALAPSGARSERDWDSCSHYARRHLAAHAAACGDLDTLVCDPGFLLAADPGSILAERGKLHTSDGRRALAAFDLAINDWESFPAGRLACLALNAARVHARPLAAACAQDSGHEWPVRWAAWTGQSHRRLTGHSDRVRTVAVARVGDRDVIVSGSDDATVRIWDAVTGEQVKTSLAGHKGSVTSIAVGRVRDRDVIVCASSDGTVWIWDAITRHPVATPLVGHGGQVNAVAIGRAGNRDVIVSSCADGWVQVWDALACTPTGVLLTGDHEWVASVAIGRVRDRDVIVSGSDDATVRIWDAGTGEQLGTALAGHDDCVYAVALGRADDRDVIVSGSGDGTVRIWDAVTGNQIGTALAGHDDWVTSVAIGRVGDRDVIVSGSGDRTVQIWDAVTGRPIGTALAGHGDTVTSVAIGRVGDRDVIVSASDDGTVRIWDADTDDAVKTTLTGHDDWVTSVAIGRFADRDVVVSGSEDGTVRIWDADTGEAVETAEVGQVDTVTSVAIGRFGDRDIIVCGSGDCTVRVSDAATGRTTWKTLSGHSDAVMSVAVGRVGDRDVIVSGSDDKTVRIWDATSGRTVRTPLVDHAHGVTSVAIGPVGDQDVIVSASDDATVQIWDAATGDKVGTELIGHDGAVTSVTLGRAGDRDVIVSGSEDGTVQIWDAVTGRTIGTALARHDDSVTSVALGQIGDRDVIVSGSGDGTVLMHEHHPRQAKLWLPARVAVIASSQSERRLFFNGYN